MSFHSSEKRDSRVPGKDSSRRPSLRQADALTIQPRHTPSIATQHPNLATPYPKLSQATTTSHSTQPSHTSVYQRNISTQTRHTLLRHTTPQLRQATPQKRICIQFRSTVFRRASISDHPRINLTFQNKLKGEWEFCEDTIRLRYTMTHKQSTRTPNTSFPLPTSVS